MRSIEFQIDRLNRNLDKSIVGYSLDSEPVYSCPGRSFHILKQLIRLFHKERNPESSTGRRPQKRFVIVEPIVQEHTPIKRREKRRRKYECV